MRGSQRLLEEIRRVLAQAGFDEPNAAAGALRLQVQEGEGVLLRWRPQGIVCALSRVGHEDDPERRTAPPGLPQALDSALAAILEAAGFQTRVVEPGWLLASRRGQSAGEPEAGAAPCLPRPTSHS
ncbi:hypothetical protein ACF1G0_34655 [Streptomyces sp. NPDC013953]|uniref:hypothetical protein n=1 Tax=Streptomyces sp. NPDC013953 TaxID=3364868 RepID=UPI0036FFBBBD